MTTEVITHHSSLITHHSPLIIHHSSFIIHHSSFIIHHSSFIALTEIKMQFHQFYLSCLAHASYLVGDGGECAIVDPQRDVDQYIDAARERGLAIRYIIETHL